MPSTNAFYIKNNLKESQSRVGDTAALIGGMGVSGTPVPDGGVADKNLFALYNSTSATSGDHRGIYWKLSFKGAGSGEVVRNMASVETTNVATGGTVNGQHATLSVAASSSVSGAGNAIRATLGAAAESRTLGGTCAALQVDSDIGANNTVPTSWSFIRVTDSGSVKIPYLLNIPSPSNGTIFATHTTQAMTHSIKIVAANGTPYYIMCTNAATNRG